MPDFLFLASFSDEIKNPREYLLLFWKHTTFIYLDGEIIGAFTLELFRKSAELHGGVRLDWRETRREDLKKCVEFALTVLKRRIFLELKRPVLFTKIDKNNLAARIWAVSHGFNKTDIADKGRILYRMRDDDGQGQKQQYPSANGGVSV